MTHFIEIKKQSQYPEEQKYTWIKWFTVPYTQNREQHRTEGQDKKSYLTFHNSPIIVKTVEDLEHTLLSFSTVS